MFDSLRGRFQSVQENLSASFRGLSLQETHEYNPSIGTPKVNLNSGIDLLDHYQKSWEELHSLSQKNATGAKDADKDIRTICKRIDKQRRDVSQLSTIVSGIPKLEHNVKFLSEKIDSMSELFSSVEKLLIDLQDLIETRDLQERQLDHRFQLALYKEKKLAELEAFRVKIVQEHAEKLTRHELRQQRISRERQETFERQFKRDLEEFKDNNHLPVVMRKSNEVNETKLEDVEIDNNEEIDESLNEFLTDDVKLGT